MHGHRIGYVRVSSFDQNPEHQLDHVQVREATQPESLGTSKKETIAMIGNRVFTALMVGWLLTSAVQAEPRPGDIAGVYPSAGPGDRKLYAIARVNPGAGPATTRSGESIIQVFVTGRGPPRRRDRQSLLCGAAGCVHVRATRRAPLGTGAQSLHPN